MPKVTSGHVMFHRVKKDDEYGIVRKVEVQLSFEVPQDGAEDAHLIRTNEVLADCVMFVNAALARAPGADLIAGTPASKAAPEAASNDKAKLAVAATAPPAAAKKVPKPPKVETPAAPVASTADAASVVDEPVVEAKAAEPAQASAADVTDDDSDLFSAEAAEITEEDLVSAITKTNAIIKDGKRIRELIGKYIAPPGKAQQIDKKLRAKFLEELAAMKPAS